MQHVIEIEDGPLLAPDYSSVASKRFRVTHIVLVQSRENDGPFTLVTAQARGLVVKKDGTDSQVSSHTRLNRWSRRPGESRWADDLPDELIGIVERFMFS